MQYPYVESAPPVHAYDPQKEGWLSEGFSWNDGVIGAATGDVVRKTVHVYASLPFSFKLQLEFLTSARPRPALVQAAA